MIAFVIFKVNGKLYELKNNYFLKLLRESNSSCIHGFHTETDAVRYFERGYRRGLEIGGGAGAGTMLYTMGYNPSVITFSDEANALKWVKVAIISADMVYKLHGMGGFELVVPLHDDIAAPIWENGVKPQLIGG